MTESEVPTGTIVIVGGGHAAAALCAGLAAAGQGARVHLVCEEAELPYQRPPLSKSFLKNAQEVLQPHRSPQWYQDAGITLHRADPATTIDRARSLLRLRSGREIGYAQLVLATGARARRLPNLAQSLGNVAVLRGAADAQVLRSQLQAAQHLTVLGGGFIGLEIAASARALGKEVSVIEAAARLLQRSVSEELAEHVLRTHRDSGIDVQLGVAAVGFVVDGERLEHRGEEDAWHSPSWTCIALLPRHDRTLTNCRVPGTPARRSISPGVMAARRSLKQVTYTGRSIGRKGSPRPYGSIGAVHPLAGGGRLPHRP